jgi:hypothetical protein
MDIAGSMSASPLPAREETKAAQEGDGSGRHPAQRE